MRRWVQGDSLNLSVKVTYGADSIEKLYFSSSALGITKQLVREGTTNNWVVVLNDDDIKKIPDTIRDTSYDITAKLKDSQTLTLVYNEEIQVLKKVNPINEQN
jgi:hypothetical protein